MGSASRSPAVILILLVILSTLQAIPAWHQEPPTIENGGVTHASGYIEHYGYCDGYTTVTLITGDRVTMSRCTGGKAIFVEPHGLLDERGFAILTLGNDTFVIPQGVDLRRFDLTLFNVDYLASWGYSVLPYIPVIVSVRAPSYSPQPTLALEVLRATLEAVGVEVSYMYAFSGLAALRVPLESSPLFFSLASRSPLIERVWLDRVVYVPPIEVSSSQLESREASRIRAHEAWKLGIDGSGVRIAIIDTGVDWSHPALAGKVVDSVSFVEIPEWEAGDPRDYHGHGTHVAAIAAGRGVNVTTAVLTPNDWVLVDRDYGEARYYKLRIYAGSMDKEDVVYVEYKLTLTLSSTGAEHVVSGVLNGRPKSPEADVRVELSFDVDGDGVLDGVKSVYVRVWVENNNTIYFLGDNLRAYVEAWNGERWDVLYGRRMEILPGIAPGALVMNVKVLNWQGYGYESWIIRGIEYAVLGPDGVPGTGDEAHIINLSLGSWIPSDGYDPLSMAVDWAVENGVIAVVAAGNHPTPFHIGSPAASRGAITVGAIGEPLPPNLTLRDLLMNLLGPGPTVDFRAKPEVVAPGFDVVSATPWGAEAWSGTSMATPHVSGLAALLKQAYNASPGLAKSLVVSTASPIADNVLLTGGGLVDTLRAVTSELLIEPAVVNLGSISGSSQSLVRVTLTLKSRSDRTLNLSITARLLEVISGVYVEALKPEVERLVVEPGGLAAVTVTLNTSLKPGLYSGIIELVDLDTNLSWRALLGFAKTTSLSINVIDRRGELSQIGLIVVLRDKFENIYDYGYTTAIDDIIWFMARGAEKLVIPIFQPGVYRLANLNGESKTFTIESVFVDKDVEVTLDERRAVPVKLDVGDRLYEMLAIRALVSLQASGHVREDGAIGIFSSTINLEYLGVKPRDPSIYITPNNLPWEFNYMFYLSQPEDGNLSIVEWYNIYYSRDGIHGPTNFTLDTPLVRKITEYRALPGFNRGFVSQGVFMGKGLIRVARLVPYEIKAPHVRVEHLTPWAEYVTSYSLLRDEADGSRIVLLFDSGIRRYLGEVREVYGGLPILPRLNVQSCGSTLSGVVDIAADSYGNRLLIFSLRGGTLGLLPRAFVGVYDVEQGRFESRGYFYVFAPFWFPATSREYRVFVNYSLEDVFGLRVSAEFSLLMRVEARGQAVVIRDCEPPSVSISFDGIGSDNIVRADFVSGLIEVVDRSPVRVYIEASFDKGRTWHKAMVKEAKRGAYIFFVPYRVEGATTLSLRVTVVDSEGNRASYTLLDAIQVEPSTAVKERLPRILRELYELGWDADACYYRVNVMPGSLTEVPGRRLPC